METDKLPHPGGIPTEAGLAKKAAAV